MKASIGRYEFKHLGQNEWQPVSEKIVLENLVDDFDPVTPVLSKMLSGEEISTSQGFYRKSKAQ